MELIFNSMFYRSLSEGRAVELWEDNRVVDGWTMYTVVSLSRDEATVLAELRVRGDQIERSIINASQEKSWIPLE